MSLSHVFHLFFIFLTVYTNYLHTRAHSSSYSCHFHRLPQPLVLSQWQIMIHVTAASPVHPLPRPEVHCWWLIDLFPQGWNVIIWGELGGGMGSFQTEPNSSSLIIFPLQKRTAKISFSGVLSLLFPFFLKKGSLQKSLEILFYLALYFNEVAGCKSFYHC